MVVIGVVAALSSWRQVRAAREQTVLPVKLQSGLEFRTRVRTSAKCELVIELALSRNEGVPRDLLEEALTRETNAVNIEWKIRQAGTICFSGSSTNARKLFTGSAAATTKGIGQFKPRHAGTYEFEATINSDLPELERTHPRIIIRPNRAFAMHASVGGSISIFAGIVLGLVGLILILLAQREPRSVARRV